MVSRWQWFFLQLGRTLWIRVSALCLLAILTALVAVWAGPLIPFSFSTKIGADAVGEILNILASSMLAVTTFSLSVMVSAYSAAANNVTPRATKLLMQDSTTQNVIATFIGSFVYSLVGIIALSRNAYGSSGRVVIYVVTIGVIALIVITILRWIEHLSRLGRVGHTTAKVESATLAAFNSRLAEPFLGGRALVDKAGQIPGGSLPVFTTRIGYLQHVDISMLSHFADTREWDVYVNVLPGSYIHPAKPVAYVNNVEAGSEDELPCLCDAFTIGEERSFDQDPRFGLVVLAEIGTRALSPAVNDPGTAIDVIGRAVRLLIHWSQDAAAPDDDVRCPRVWVSDVSVEDMFDDVFMPLARDGAGMVEIHVRLQKGFASLHQCGGEPFKRVAQRHSRLAMERAEHALDLDSEIARLRGLADAVSANPV